MDSKNTNKSSVNFYMNKKDSIYNKNIRNKSFVENGYASKKKKKFNSKLFTHNNNS